MPKMGGPFQLVPVMALAVKPETMLREQRAGVHRNKTSRLPWPHALYAK
jgi:hypothetical protein